MRLAILAVIATGCGGHASAPAALAADEPELAALRWVPAKPSFVVASRDLGAAQHSLRDLVDVLGSAAGFELRDATQAIAGLLGVDALHPEAIAAIGIDPHASWAAFSEALSPTVVVRLASPDLMIGFLAHQRERGLVTESVIVRSPGPAGRPIANAAGGSSAATGAAIEVFSATLAGHVRISWAIADGWMWLHVAPPIARGDPTGWFMASYAPHRAEWTRDWSWAQRAAGASSGIVGFADLRGAVARALARLPSARACGALIEPVQRVAVAATADDHRVALRLGFDLGSTARLGSLVLAPPSGWAATAARAAIAVQWNLDLAAVQAWLAPCLAGFGGDAAAITATGIRSARGLVLEFDPDGPSGSGALAFDLAHAGYVRNQLDRIPLRSALERARTFGADKGFSIALPFAPTIDYVLDDRRAIAALGDGVLARVVAPGALGPAPVFALDLAPPVLSQNAWAALIQLALEGELASSPGPVATRMAEHLMRWRDGHLAIALEPGELVFTASGDRR
jgi:hypothetical protein